MKKLLFIFFAMTLHQAGLFAQVSESSRYGENPEQLFDFWIGEWKVFWDEQDSTKGEGTNTISWALDNVLQEDFKITKGRNKGFRGTSISVYQKRLNVWRQAWADNAGGYFSFKGEKDGDKKMFITDIVEKDGKQFRQRMVFHSIKEDTLIWDWEASEDGGKSWKLNWRIYYERMETSDKL
ncbi:MAG: hypothetical protein ACNS60_06595 [Candidatus Cyclobacteriaceae bacterium M2_1C_046]